MTLLQHVALSRAEERELSEDCPLCRVDLLVQFPSFDERFLRGARPRFHHCPCRFFVTFHSFYLVLS